MLFKGYSNARIILWVEKMIEKTIDISNKEVKDIPPQCFIAYHVYVMEEKEAVKESERKLTSELFTSSRALNVEVPSNSDC